MAGRAILLALLPVSVLAFSNTHPLVAWSSRRSSALSAAHPLSTHSSDLLESIFANDIACAHDAVILVDQEGLYASDLRTLSSDSSISKALVNSPAKLERPYLRTNETNPFIDVSHALARRCGSRHSSYIPEQVDGLLDIEGARKDKHVVCIGLPALESGMSGAERKTVMAAHESKLASALNTLLESFPDSLVVYAGWGSTRSPLFSRELLAEPFATPSSSDPASKAAASESGILHNYRLLTPALILTLILVLFVLLPTIFLGVNALASIRVPSGLGVDPVKGWSAGEKKNQ